MTLFHALPLVLNLEFVLKVYSATIFIANAEARDHLVGDHLVGADILLARLVGLLGKNGLEPGSGLLIEPSSGVHTFAMRLPINIIAPDRNRCVRGIWPCSASASKWGELALSFRAGTPPAKFARIKRSFAIGLS